MIGPLQFAGWEVVALVLATPVVLWGAWPFHRAAWRGLRHRTATMDTLISIGTLAAWLWSVAAVVADAEHLYLEVASVVTVFVLAGRLLESRAAAGRARRSRRSSHRRRDAAVLSPDGTERRVPVEAAARRRPLRRAPRRARRHRRRRRGRVLGGRHIDAHRRVAPGRGRPGRRRRRRFRRTPADASSCARPASAPTPRWRRSPGSSREAQSGKAPVQRLADRVSAVFVPAVHRARARDPRRLARSPARARRRHSPPPWPS